MGHGVLGFAIVAAILVLTPGPDFAVVLPNALRSRRAGAATAVGTASGLAVHAVAAALGLSLLLKGSAEAFTAVKVAGALVLCVLGVRALRASRRRPESTEPKRVSAPPLPAMRAYRQGFFVNVLNPKAPVIYLSVMPQFLDPHLPANPQLALMSAILVALALIWYLVLTLLVQYAREPILRVRHWIDRVTGTVLILLGIRLAFERQPA